MHTVNDEPGGCARTSQTLPPNGLHRRRGNTISPEIPTAGPDRIISREVCNARPVADDTFRPVLPSDPRPDDNTGISKPARSPLARGGQRRTRRIPFAADAAARLNDQARSPSPLPDRTDSAGFAHGAVRRHSDTRNAPINDSDCGEVVNKVADDVFKLPLLLAVPRAAALLGISRARCVPPSSVR